jgi:protein CMS1
VEHLERIVIDASHIDQKKRGILDMPETQEPLITLLNRKELKERYSLKDKGIQLIFY